MSKEINDKLAKLKQSLGKSEKKDVDNKLENLNKTKKSRQGKHGGARPGAGRNTKQENLIKNGIKAWVDKHINEDVEVQVPNKHGKLVTMKKQRIMYILEKLYRKATKGEGDTAAMGLWLDRALGKAPQPLKGDENDDTPIRIGLDITSVLDKGYKDEDDD